MRTLPWPRLSTLVSASLVFSVTNIAWAAPADPGPSQSAPSEVAGPPGGSSGDVAPPATPEAKPTEVGSEAPPPAEAGGPADPAVAAGEEGGAVPTPPPAATEDPAPATPPVTTEREGTNSAAPGDPASGDSKIAPDLLGGEPSSPETTPRPSSRTVVQDDGSRDAAIAAAYDRRYRPDQNPGRLAISARALFANAGGEGDVGGRLGGGQVDVGQGWNRFGYAVTATAWGGRVVMGDRSAEMNAMFGIGPTLNLGRTALQQRGLIDLRVGYDFMYGVVNERSGSTIVAPSQSAGSDVQLVAARNLIPHGPRAMLQLGLVSPGNHRRFFHGVGVLLGYQGLVGSLRDELPFTHMLMTGITWWMG